MTHRHPLVSQLKSCRFGRLIARWRAFCATACDLPGPASFLPGAESRAFSFLLVFGAPAPNTGTCHLPASMRGSLRE